MIPVPAPKTPSDLQALLPAPGSDGYKFFEHATAYPLRKTTDFCLVNACWLIDCAYLVYSTAPEYVSDRLKEAGLNCRTFGFDRTQPPHTFVADNTDVIIVAFRGTRIQELADILADASIIPEITGNGLVHSGFQTALRSGGIWDETQTYIRSTAGSQIILFTGHSLGAALATLARRSYRDPAARNQALYTFGSPRVGDPLVFCHNYPSNDYRIVNDEDVITHVPTPPGYGHVGTSYGPDGRAHSMSVLLQLEDQFSAIAGALALSNFGMRRQRLLDFFAAQQVKPLADHAPRCYAAKLWNALGV
jgi:hypothetical protein